MTSLLQHFIQKILKGTLQKELDNITMTSLKTGLPLNFSKFSVMDIKIHNN